MALATLFPWARDLTQGTASHALLALSLGAGSAASEQDAVALLSSEFQAHPVPLLAMLPAPGTAWAGHLSPAQLAASFEGALGAPSNTRAVAVPAHAFDASTTRDWLGPLRDGLEASPHVDQVVLHGASKASAQWSWPLRIGVLTDRRHLGGLQELFDHRWYGLLFELASAATRPHRFDLLIVEGSGPKALGRLTRSGADAVVVARVGPRAATVQGDVESLFMLTRASKAAVGTCVALGPQDWTGWLTHLVAALSHGDPLHRALEHADPTGPAMILGDRTALPSLQLLSTVEQALERETRATSPFRSPPEVRKLPARLEQLVGVGDATARQVVETVRDQGLASLAFHSEDLGATTLGTLKRFLDDTERRAALRAVEQAGPGARFLQARLSRAGEAAHPPFRPGPDELAVRIGPVEAGWIDGSRPAELPSAPVDGPQGWRLRIVAWEPSWMPEPQERQLWLPEVGAAAPAVFELASGEQESDPSPDVFAARIVVLHANRVLQTGVLTVDASGSRFRIDAAPEPQLARIDTARWFDASIVLNDDISGRHTATVTNEGSLGVTELNEEVFDQFTDQVSRQLGAIADAPERYAGLEAEGTVELLRGLARIGFRLFRSLTRSGSLHADTLRRASRIQIVSTRAHTFFPAEFLYELDSPSPEATLCPGAIEALESGRSCTYDHDEDVFCPLGFWSLSKLVERHAHRRENVDLPGPFQLFARDHDGARTTVDPLRDVLFAASDRANAYDAEATAKVLQRADAVARDVQEVPDWAAWRASIAARPRSLLLLLPHFGSGDSLEIGEGSSLDVILERHVHVREAEGPVAVLLGCHTLLTRYAFNDFVQSFLWSGAKAVLATYGTILGRHAGPGAAHLLDALHEAVQAEHPVRLAKVVQQVKRRMLLRGEPMILGLTTHGDADLLIHRHP